jgi:hypothetical protein
MLQPPHLPSRPRAPRAARPISADTYHLRAESACDIRDLRRVVGTKAGVVRSGDVDRYSPSMASSKVVGPQGTLRRNRGGTTFEPVAGLDRLRFVRTQLWDFRHESSDWAKIRRTANPRSRRCNHGPSFAAISLHESRLAWSYEVCVKLCANAQEEVVRSYVAVEALPAGRRQVVASADLPCQVSWPSLWGNVLAWHRQGQCGHARQSDVFNYNFANRAVTQVTHYHGSYEPATNGRYLAWVQGLPGDSDVGGRIMLRDLADGRQMVVSNRVHGSTSGCYQPSMCQSHPVMSSSLVAWSGQFRDDFKAFDPPHQQRLLSLLEHQSSSSKQRSRAALRRRHRLGRRPTTEGTAGRPTAWRLRRYPRCVLETGKDPAVHPEGTGSSPIPGDPSVPVPYHWPQSLHTSPCGRNRPTSA